MSCLLYDQEPLLEAFLNLSGNAVLAEALVRVDKIMDEDGLATQIYAVLVGLGRYVRHYNGIRRQGPNAALVACPAEGSNDGFLRLVATTRNGGGIAAKTPIVINFGAEYEHGSRLGADDPEMKRFRGALDRVFEEQKKAAAAVQPSAEERVVLEPPPTPGLGAGSPPTPTVQEESKQVAVESPKRKEPTPLNPEGGKSSEGVGAVAKVAKTAALLGTEIGPHKMSAYFIPQVGDVPAKLSLTLPEDAQSNKKLPPRTIIWHLLGEDGGRVVRSKVSKMLWRFEKPTKTVVVAKSKEGELFSAPQDLAGFIRDHGAVGVAKHVPTFGAGKPPASLSQEDDLAYVCKESTHAEILNFACSSAGLLACFVVKLAKDKVVVPVGIAVLNGKQAVVAHGATYDFM